MRRLDSLSAEERWGKPPVGLVDDFLAYAREQFALVVEDLSAFPVSPPIVAEGPQLLPELAGAAAVFLVPTEEFQRRAFVGRNRHSNVVARDVPLGRAIREQATELGRRVIDVDGSLGPEALVELFESVFAPILANARPAPDLRALRREENQAVHENLVAAGGTSYPFACECGRSGCTERVELSLTEFTSLERVVAPAHAR
jgi:hypothetical protein